MIPSPPPSSFRSHTHRVFSLTVLLFLSFFFFRLWSPLQLFLFLRTLLLFTPPHPPFFFFKKKNFSFLYSYSQLPFFFHLTVPPDLPSLHISLALGLLNCAFYLHAALQYSGGGGLFSSHVHFRDCTVPSTVPIHLPPTSSSSHGCS